MIIERWTGPPVDTHTYLVYDEPSREAWVIDAPLNTADAVLQRVETLGLTLTRMVLTHGHFDHLMDVERYAAAGVPVAAHAADRALLEAPQTSMFGLPYPMPKFAIDEKLTEGQRLSLGENEFEVRHTPGHAPGHVILYSPAADLILGGDLLFHQGFGRIDLPGANPLHMADSLERLLTLPDHTLVHPGHGQEITIGSERIWLPSIITKLRMGQTL